MTTIKSVGSQTQAAAHTGFVKEARSPIWVAHSNIARVEPAASEALLCLLFILQVALHHEIATAPTIHHEAQQQQGCIQSTMHKLSDAINQHCNLPVPPTVYTTAICLSRVCLTESGSHPS